MSAASQGTPDICYSARETSQFLSPYLRNEWGAFFNNSWEAGSEVSIVWVGSSLANRYTLTVKSVDSGYGYDMDISLLSTVVIEPLPRFRHRTDALEEGVLGSRDNSTPISILDPNDARDPTYGFPLPQLNCVQYRWTVISIPPKAQPLIRFFLSVNDTDEFDIHSDGVIVTSPQASSAPIVRDSDHRGLTASMTFGAIMFGAIFASCSVILLFLICQSMAKGRRRYAGISRQKTL